MGRKVFEFQSNKKEADTWGKIASEVMDLLINKGYKIVSIEQQTDEYFKLVLDDEISEEDSMDQDELPDVINWDEYSKISN